MGGAREIESGSDFLGKLDSGAAACDGSKGEPDRELGWTRKVDAPKSDYADAKLAADGLVSPPMTTTIFLWVACTGNARFLAQYLCASGVAIDGSASSTACDSQTFFFFPTRGTRLDSR